MCALARQDMGKQPAVVEAPSKYQVRYPIGFSLSAAGGAGAAGGDVERPGPVDGALMAEAGAGAGSTLWEAMWERFHLKGLGSKRQHALERHLSLGGVDPATTSPGPPLRADEAVHVGAPRILTVFLPLIAVVVPEWLRVLKQRGYASQGGPPPKKVLVLVSGAGQPRDMQAKSVSQSVSQSVSPSVSHCHTPAIEHMVHMLHSRAGQPARQLD